MLKINNIHVSARRRTALLCGAALAASLSLAGPPAAMAASVKASINGGGASAAAPLIAAELALVNGLNSPKYAFNSYYPVSSSVLETALIDNDATQFGLPAESENVDFGNIEQPLAPAQLQQWASVTTGQAQAGDIIQVPLMGASLAIPVINSSVTANGQLVLSDNQLCAIFSGVDTDWSQVSASITSGPITVVYRTDSAGTSYQLTAHLAQVCTTGPSGNSNFAPNFAASSVFATVFTNSVVPTNFKGVQKLIGVANDLNTESSAIGYISPDWTTEYPKSLARLSNGNHSALVIAALSAEGGIPYLPTIANIQLALSNPGAGSFPTLPPSSRQEALIPTNWLPQIPVTLKGYPIVSYSGFLLPQCFANPNTALGMVKFLDLHYGNTKFEALQKLNGYVRIANTPAASFYKAVVENILGNANGWNLNVQNHVACTGLSGR